MKSIQTTTFLLTALAFCGCGGGYSSNNSSNQATPLAGNWNAVLTVNGSTTPQYTLGLAIAQSATTFNVSPIAFTGGAGHGDTCFGSSSFTGQGNSSGNNFSMILTDSGGNKLKLMGSFSGYPSSINATYFTQYAPVEFF